MSTHNPTHGQKVDLGKDAPTTKEGTGAVTKDSLAADSQAFKDSNDVSSKDISHENPTSTTKSHKESSNTYASHTGTGNSAKSVPEAPSYVHGRDSARDTSGPHGKNIKEDDSIGTDNRAKNASFTEFGTKADPGRVAEEKFATANSTSASSTATRQSGVDGENAYSALDSERQA